METYYCIPMIMQVFGGRYKDFEGVCHVIGLRDLAKPRLQPLADCKSTKDFPGAWKRVWSLEYLTARVWCITEGCNFTGSLSKTSFTHERCLFADSLCITLLAGG